MTLTVESSQSVLKKLYPDGELGLRVTMGYMMMWVEIYLWNLRNKTYQERSTLVAQLRAAFRLACHRKDFGFTADGWVRKRGFQYQGMFHV